MSDINEIILFQIDKTSKIAKQYTQTEFDKLKLGITVDQWVLLKIIEESEQLSQKELAVKSSRDPASITRTLDILEKKQLTLRLPTLGNRRQYSVELTKNGHAFMKKNMGLVTWHRNKSVEGFTSEELNLLGNMLERIQGNMR